MALSAQQLDQLHVSWDGAGLALWALDGQEVVSSLALRSLATVAFGYGGLALLGPGVTPLYLPTPGAVTCRARVVSGNTTRSSRSHVVVKRVKR